jgi:hypothetical protein
MQNATAVELTFRDWLDNFAPRNLVQSEQNMQMIADYIAEKRQGIVTTTTLNQAVEALRGQLAFVHEPSAREKETAEAKKAEARQRRDYQNSIKDRSVTEVQNRNAQDATEAKQKAEAKELANLKSEIAREIGNYIAGHPSGGTNYSATEEGRGKLQKVAGAYPLLKTVAEAKQVLENVRSAKYKLP